jgi:hypothetical protein
VYWFSTVYTFNMSDALVLYQAENGAIEFRGDSSKDTLWATLDQLAELFQRNKSSISRHVHNILKESELDEQAVVAVFATTAKDGKTYQFIHYNKEKNRMIGLVLLLLGKNT